MFEPLKFDCTCYPQKKLNSNTGKTNYLESFHSRRAGEGGGGEKLEEQLCPKINATSPELGIRGILRLI